MIMASEKSQPTKTDDIADTMSSYEDVARLDIARIVATIQDSRNIRAMLGQPYIVELPNGAFFFGRENRTVVLRAGISGELSGCDRKELLNSEAAAPVIFVNIVECPLCITPYETDCAILLELADQLGVWKTKDA